MFKLLKIKYAQSTTKLCSKLIYTQSKICKKVLLYCFNCNFPEENLTKKKFECSFIH